MDRLKLALINTIIVILIIPLIGFVLNCIINIIAKIIVNCFGSRVGDFILNKFTFIGTVHHELSHALFAFCTGAKVSNIKLYKREKDSLGCVKFSPRGNKVLQAIQLTLTSIAPVITGPISIYLLYSKALTICEKTWQVFIVYYIMISILIHTTMSKQDIKISLKGLPLCVIIIYIIMLATGLDLTTIAI